MEILLSWLSACWDVMMASSIYMIFGFFIAGIMKAFIPENLVSNHLGRGKFLPVLKASLFGAPIPLCSCGVLPAAAGLREQGANKGATAAFLVSTPETGVDSVAVTYALLDPFMAVIRPVTAVITAIISGVLINFEKEPEKKILTPLNIGCGCGCSNETAKPSIKDRIIKGWRFAFGDLLSDIGPWFLFGVGLAGAISIWITTDMIQAYFANEWLSMIFMLAVAIPMYVCATASTPIAAALVLKGISPGAALVFLMAGPATNAAGLTVIMKLLGKRATAVYLISLITVTLIAGWVVNRIYAYLGINAMNWAAKTHHEEYNMLFFASAVLLLGMMVWAIGKKIISSWHSETCGCDGSAHSKC